MTATSSCVPKGNLTCHLPLQEAKILPRFSGSDLGVIHITASVLDLGVCEILPASFKSGVSLSSSPLALLFASPTGLQSQMFRELIFLTQGPQTGEPNLGLSTLVLWGKSLQLWLFSHLWVYWLGCGFWLYSVFVPISLWFLFYIFTCRISFLLVS